MGWTNAKKTWQWEVVATQAYLKNMNALFITHGQSFGNCARIEFDDLPRQNWLTWGPSGGPVGASTPKCKVQPTNNMEKKTALMCCLVRGGSFPCVEWRTTWGITPKPWQPKLPNSWVFVSSCWTPGHDQALSRWMTFPETIVSEKYRLG